MPRLILVPLPDADFDTTEVAIPWKLLTGAGHEVVFATEKGDAAPRCDPRLLEGVIFGKLGASDEAKACYAELQNAPAFQRPMAWAALDPSAFDGLLLPGGHAPGMRQYLGSRALQAKVAAFWNLDRPVAAICHGVLVLARAVDPESGKSVLAGHKTTCLPAYMERAAFLATFWKLGRYYRTYPAYVEEEVEAALGPEGTFERGPIHLGGKPVDGPHAFVVHEGRYVSARWPGDAWALSRAFLERLA